MNAMSNPRAPYILTSDHPRLDPPTGCPLIVHVVVNIEYWAYDQLTPRTIVIPPHGKSHVPDLPNFCWSEYGNRAGMPRLIELFTSRGIPVSASINASVIDVYPGLAEAVLEADWEFIGHGMHQRALGEEADEATLIAAALERLETFTGKRPRGWMSPGWSETFDTLDHLRANGIEYVCQWVIDDVPTRLKTRHGPMVSLPYGLDINDSVVFAIEKHASSEMRLRIEETIRTFEREITEQGQPRVLTIPLHPHLSGVPHRINHLSAVIDQLMSRSDTVFMNGSQILDWYKQASPDPAA
jgi:peptidoglycan/xylan/chitin deacetylase (PgdA/CDA1 family)